LTHQYHFKKINSGTEKLYYDFSLDIGDTLPEYLGCTTPIYECVIVEDITYKKMLNGEDRKVWHLSYNDSDIKELWIEGMGSNCGVIFPVSASLVGETTELLCVHENNVLLYNDNFWGGGVCYKSSWLSMANDLDRYINIFPNPANKLLHIKLNENIIINAISLINIQGQVVRSYETATTQLDVSDITEGIYFIKIYTLEGNIIKKVIINK